MRNLISLLLLALLTTAPAALAQDEPKNETRPDDAAWVEDCPPDMMCAASGSEEDEPVELGPEGCIECTQAPREDGATCMDGASETEICDSEVQYLNGSPEPEQGGVISAPVEDAPPQRAVPAPAVALAILAVAAALVLARR